jgi:hypothetical protein
MALPDCDSVRRRERTTTTALAPPYVLGIGRVAGLGQAIWPRPPRSSCEVAPRSPTLYRWHQRSWLVVPHPERPDLSEVSAAKFCQRCASADGEPDRYEPPAAAHRSACRRRDALGLRPLQDHDWDLAAGRFFEVCEVRVGRPDAVAEVFAFFAVNCPGRDLVGAGRELDGGGRVLAQVVVPVRMCRLSAVGREDDPVLPVRDIGQRRGVGGGGLGAGVMQQQQRDIRAGAPDRAAVGAER